MSANSAVPATANPQRTVGSGSVSAQRFVAISYLRAFVTLLVVAHHAALAYHPFGPIAPPASLLAQPRWWQAFPILDTQRWTGFALLVSFNDIFFMALMFFLSGLFVWHSLERKGASQFLRDRALRLGLPFLVAAAVVAPLAYYPAYLETGGSGIAGFWKQWSALGNWPAGPAWFVWVLLAFDVIAAGLLMFKSNWGTSIGRLSAGSDRHPIRFFGILVALSAAVYVPLAVIFNPFAWASFGPFFFQTSRILHYFVYFLVGAGVGAYGLNRGLLALDGKLARRWWLWCLRALFAFGLAAGLGLAAMTTHIGSRLWETMSDIGFVISCAASSFAYLALFVRFALKPRKVFDSLSNNAYGMYLVHYAFVSWLQYGLLKSALPAAAKGSLVFLATVVVSWVTVAALRRIPAVARVI
jgi:peptidoglycan/LPS O-acetylase OafA/YrhL